MKEHNLEMLSGQPWEETLEFLTADMEPGSIDVAVLADRYRQYIREMQQLDLSVSARAVRICAALLKMKTMALNYEEDEPQRENPMDFEGDLEMLEEADEGPVLEEGPELEIPVKPRPKRRMQMDELKTALRDAMEVKERREQRQEERIEIDQQFQTQEQTINERINSLFSRLTSLVSGGDEIRFNRLLDENTNEEKIEKFLHVLHLENDQKVTCKQEEFLGDLYVKPEEKPEGVAN